MSRYLLKSILLLFFLVIIICGIYPMALWMIGQTVFPFQANGSLLNGADGKSVGSKLIAQPFTKDTYFQPRPSAASYDASASSSSALAASNYALRDRVARMLGPMVTYQTGQLVAPDMEQWFQQDKFQGKPHIVAQWATQHFSLAKAWVTANPAHETYVNNWAKMHQAIVAEYVKDNPSHLAPKAVDLAVLFFQHFSQDNPGKFPATMTATDSHGKMVTLIQAVSAGSDIQATFFDMWLQDHPEVKLQNVPGDLVTTSASGLDPHITLQNALFQLNRVAHAWAVKLRRHPADMTQEIQNILTENSEAPFHGLIGESYVNVLIVNLELRKRYGEA